MLLAKAEQRKTQLQGGEQLMLAFPTKKAPGGTDRGLVVAAILGGIGAVIGSSAVVMIAQRYSARRS